MFAVSIASNDGILFCGLTNSLSITSLGFFAGAPFLPPPDAGISSGIILSPPPPPPPDELPPPFAGLDISPATCVVASFFLVSGFIASACAILSFAKLIGSLLASPGFTVFIPFFFLPPPPPF
tara:strand:+ start:2222 stop:2590 length:369 start_codon:yes stop_codon:yes gene_type:complete